MTSGFPTWPEELFHFYEKECWTNETFGSMLKDRAKTYGEKIAIKSNTKELSYRELDQKADELAAGFQKLGLKKGDKVVLQLPNEAEFFEVCFALFRLGVLPVFALPSHRYSEIQYFCEFAEAAAYIIYDKHGGYDYRKLAREVQKETPSLKHVIVVGEAEEFLSLSDMYEKGASFTEDVEPNDFAFLQLSGGSTGRSKLIPRMHNDYIYSLVKSNEICGMNEDSVYLTVLPVAHNYPLSSPGVLGTLYGGGKVVLARDPSPDEAFALIEKENVTITGVVPPVVLIWLEARKTRNEDLSSLQVIQVGGAKLSAEAAKRISPAFGCTLQQVYGMAEGLVNYTRLHDSDERVIFTQGKPMSEYDEIRIVDENDQIVGISEVGELLTRGPYTIQGYYKGGSHNERAFTKDGFYRTGDLVKVDEEGYITVEGRHKDQINRGGEKIAAEEVENHLLAHEDVYDAAIVSMPDPFLGERSCAYIIPYREGVKAASLKKFLKEIGLAAFKIPDRIEFVQKFPQTPLGKVDKKSLRQMIEEKLNQQTLV
ncbi:(2,3-dihydroxybenzoyl)adenylate synthase [Priestia filamentosa]|uniref:(2,3-dihydroxybenzoyl)adenylate synthase n=1 Tax=Priestia filamentosa TaxID=1402861 RepID=A0A1X7DB88_9BACI|nr:(2,3-dihydroxybenzoyl)adenylate synthase [Priestia filamentosa]AKO93620.1 (2,3-dihydroxybenzoyl)adenylate synthase [Priestia filamentosa]MDT3763834.1 (2,3-dihydroxybenzoyl)adenylate synthase [Priestia filamentosa]OXS71683.1 2,3-dihydroxybenzoate-AMP ligase [Priestia filamentosa]WRU94252.1 (2,3-dihydroxybenzoyl)adenylate synthase [Priestia filamentosa]SMF12256.1 2,3-dihydroxybenzoate-AMP ligase [Priestia filamentosa]